MGLQLYRKSNPTITIPIDENTIYLDELMGRNDVTCSFYSDVPFDIKVDDYILLNNVHYTINVPYQMMRGAELQYSITFEHPSYWLKDIALRHLGTIEFSYFGTPQSFVNLIVECMNASDEGWTVGRCETMDEMNLDFYASGSGYSCKGALQLFAEKFELEYWFSGDGKTINLTKQAGVETNIDFQYGMSRGLYSVERGVIEIPLFNRIYGFGGSSNLSQTYRSGAKRLVFDIGYIDRALTDGERRRETTIVFDDIFPERTSAATGVAQINEGTFTLTDATIDFDLQGQFLSGVEPKIIFKSGVLSGGEFKILNYNHSTKTIKYEANKDSAGALTPDPTQSIVANVGDKYTLIGIAQPASYVADAEKRLKEAVENSFKQVSRPPYRVEIDEKYMRENGFKLHSGDRVRLIDSKIGIDDKIRITSVSFPLVNQNKCTVVVSDKITYTREVEFIIDQNKVKEQVKVVDRTKSEANRVQSYRMRQLQELTFDADGYFDMDKIKPLSIETLMLSVGAKSQNFNLNGVSFEANSGDDANKFVASSGQLIHREIEITGLGYIWDIDSLTQENLDPLKHYYLSAKCSTYSLTGVWYLSEIPMKAESEVGYIHFNVGILYAVHNGKRDTGFTYGMTYINGRDITTGKISADRIDVNELFAQQITATNLTVTGDSRLAGFSIDNEKITSIDSQEDRKIHYSPGGVFARDTTDRTYIEFLLNGLFYNANRFSFDEIFEYESDVTLKFGEDNAILKIAGQTTSTSPFGAGAPHMTAFKARMGLGTAIDIIGKIIVDGSEGLTTKQGINTPDGVKYLNFKSGVLTGITTT